MSVCLEVKSEKLARAALSWSSYREQSTPHIWEESRRRCWTYRERKLTVSEKSWRVSTNPDLTPRQLGNINFNKGKSGFGETSSFLPWKLVCPGVRRDPWWLNYSTVAPTDYVPTLVSRVWWKREAQCVFWSDNGFNFSSLHLFLLLFPAK